MKELYREFNELNIEIEMEPRHVDEVERKRIKNAVLMKKKKSLIRELFTLIKILMINYK